MRRIAIAAALSLSALLAGSSVLATDTEADAIKEVFTAWTTADDGDAALVALDGLYGDTKSVACKNFIEMLFTTIGLIDIGTEFSPENKLGTELGFTLLLSNLESMEYACRIAQ